MSTTTVFGLFHVMTGSNMQYVRKVKPVNNSRTAASTRNFYCMEFKLIRRPFCSKLELHFSKILSINN